MNGFLLTPNPAQLCLCLNTIDEHSLRTLSSLNLALQNQTVFTGQEIKAASIGNDLGLAGIIWVKM